MTDVFKEYFKSNLDIIMDWIVALRSGTYLQNRGQLKGPILKEKTASGNAKIGYCCLGVFCDLSKGLDGHWDKFDFVYFSKIEGEYDFEETHLPYHLEQILSAAVVDVKDRNHLPLELVEQGKLSGALITLNDSRMSNFEQIADILEGLFFGDQEQAAESLKELGFV